MLKFINKIQTYFRVTKAELIAVFLIILGLSSGIIIDWVNPRNANFAKSSEIEAALDSAAKAQPYNLTGSYDKTSDQPDSSSQQPAIANNDSISNKKAAFFYAPDQKPITQKAGKINLNTASKTELMRIPGIGEKTALKIIEYRTATKFTGPEDIMKIKGIGIKKFEKMKDAIEAK